MVRNLVLKPVKDWKDSDPETIVRNLVLEPVKDWKDNVPDTVVAREPRPGTSKGLEGQCPGHSSS